MAPLTPLQKHLLQKYWGAQLLKNDPMQGKKVGAPRRRWGHDNIGPDRGASKVEPTYVRGVKRRWA